MKNNKATSLARLSNLLEKLQRNPALFQEYDEKIKEILRKDYKEGMSIDDGIKFCMKIFKDTLGKNFDLDRFEVGYINLSDEKLRKMQGDDLKRFTK